MMRAEKRIVAFVLALMMIVGTLPVTGTERILGADEGLLWIESSVEDGDVVLKVMGAGISDVMDMEFAVGYNPELLSLVSYKDSFLEDTHEGIKITTNDTEAGKVVYHIFWNDVNPMDIPGTVEQGTQILEFKLRPEYVGEEYLAFSLTLNNCKTPRAEEIPVFVKDYATAAPVRGKTAEHFACGLVGVNTVRPQEQIRAEFYAYEELAAGKGSFTLSFDPEKLRYVACERGRDSIKVRASDDGMGKVKFTFSTTDGKIPTGRVFSISLKPVAKGSLAAIKITEPEFADVSGKQLAVTVNDTLTVDVKESNEDYIFSLEAPKEAGVGDEISVALSIDKNKGFTILNGNITYDPELLEYTGGELVGNFKSKASVGGVEDLKEKKAEGTPASTGSVRVQIVDGNKKSAGADSSGTASEAVEAEKMDCFDEDGQIVRLTFNVKSKGTGYAYLDFCVNPKAWSFYIGTDKREGDLPWNGDGACIRLRDSSSSGGNSGNGENSGTGGNSGSGTNTSGGNSGTGGNSGNGNNSGNGGNSGTGGNSGNGGNSGTGGNSGSGTNTSGGNSGTRTNTSGGGSTNTSGGSSTNTSGGTGLNDWSGALEEDKYGGYLINEKLGMVYCDSRIEDVRILSVTNAKKGVKLTWEKKPYEGYVVLRKYGKKDYAVSAVIRGLNTTAWTDKGVKNGKTYSYQVLALKGRKVGQGGTGWQILRLNPPKITGLTAKGTKKLKLTLPENKKADRYQIQVSLKKNFAKAVKTIKLSSKKKVTKTIGGLKKGKRYYVRVRAVKGSAVSAWSTKKSTKTKKK